MGFFLIFITCDISPANLLEFNRICIILLAVFDTKHYKNIDTTNDNINSVYL